MTPEPPNKKRVTNDQTPKPAPDGDHRKRKRNRTTQSCLNCHTSKRMCDRKRPCGRCTQLGLTGLCIYEVDDPSQRNDPLDESTRLQKRVAELEGVVRELKNKPNPRWAHLRPGPPREDGSSSRRAAQGSARSAQLSKSTPNDSGSSTSSNSSETRSSPLYVSGLDDTSPLSTPSPSAGTPTEDVYTSQFAFPGMPMSQDLTRELDFASLLLSHPGLAGSDGDSFLANGELDRLMQTTGARHNPADDACLNRSGDGHCGCLAEPASYSIMLELSLRLRRAVDVLSQCRNHRMGQNCTLNQRVAQLDSFTSTALGNVMTPLDGTASNHALSHPHRLSDKDRTSSQPATGATGTGYRAVPGAGPTVSPQSLHSRRPWDSPSRLAEFSAGCEDDPFMTWDPSRSR